MIIKIVIVSFNKKVDVRTFRKVTVTTVEAEAVTDQSSRGVGEKNCDNPQGSENVQEEIDLSILFQKGAPTYLDFKTKDEYKTSPESELEKSESKVTPTDKKFSKLRSFFRKDFNIFKRK